MSGRNDGPGHVDAGRRPRVDDGRELRGRALDHVVLAHELAAPVQERDQQQDDTDQEQRTAEHEPEQQRGRAEAAHDGRP